MNRRVVEIALPKSALTATNDLDVEQVYEQTADFVWRTLQRMGIPPRDLQDVHQEVYIVVHRKLASYDGRCKLTTWLFGICSRVANRHRRRAYFRREQLVEQMPEGADGNTPEDNAQRDLDRRQLNALLDTLSPEKRATFVLFEIEHQSCEKIAEMTGVAVGTVHSRLSSARNDFLKAAERWRRRSQHLEKS